jgi:hypothetical protein
MPCLHCVCFFQNVHLLPDDTRFLILGHHLENKETRIIHYDHADCAPPTTTVRTNVSTAASGSDGGQFKWNGTPGTTYRVFQSPCKAPGTRFINDFVASNLVPWSLREFF